MKFEYCWVRHLESLPQLGLEGWQLVTNYGKFNDYLILMRPLPNKPMANISSGMTVINGDNIYLHNDNGTPIPSRVAAKTPQ